MKLPYFFLLVLLFTNIPSYAVHIPEGAQQLVVSSTNDMETKSNVGIGLGVLSFLTILGLALGSQPVFLVGVVLGLAGTIWNAIFLAKAKRKGNRKAKRRSLLGLILSLIGAIIPVGLLIFAILSI